jgi:LPXTG-motif cell wall-anchored protein
MLGILLISARPTGEFHGSMPLFLGAFTMISLILIGFGIVLFKKRKEWVHNSKMTYGKIVEISKRYSRDDHSGRFPIYFPIVAYYVNGLEFRREADKGLAKTCEIGQEIPVRYLSENPYEASLTENTVPGLNPSIFFVMGLLMLGSAIILFVLKS